MRKPRLSKLELQIMDVLWSNGPSSIRGIQEQTGAEINVDDSGLVTISSSEPREK